MKIVWVIMILKADVLLINGQSCAGTYDTLPDLERRSTNYVLAANEAYVSDSLLDSKWYKVNRYNMPTNYSNLDIGMCGTYFPIWMNGSIPSSSEGQVTRNVCIISFYEVCNPVKTIEVVNCSTFMLYKLVPTIHSSGYCFDSTNTTPPPPCNVNVNSVTNNSLNLSWTGPSDFNGPFKGYIVCIMEWIYLDQQSSNEKCHYESIATFHAKNLTSGAFYNFSVYSVNSMYNSTTPATSGVIQTVEGTPDEVENLDVKPSADNMRLTWNRPKHPYGNITAYKIKVVHSTNESDCHILWLKANEFNINTSDEYPKCRKQQEQKIVMNANITEVNITGLSPDISYNISVTAYTNKGAGKTVLYMINTSETAPGNVTNVTGVAISSTEINVTWQIPPLRTGATVYFIEEYDKINNKLKETKSVTGFYVQTVSFTSLQPYWVYQFAVFVSTSQGNSSRVYSDNVTTKESNPGAPVGLMVKLHNESICNATRVDFRWIEPDLINRNGKITKYNIALKSEKGETTNYIMDVENPTPYYNHSRNWTTILKTMAENNYNVQVWAVTQTGLNGTMANTSFNSIACKPPKPPDNPNLIAVTETTTSSFKVQLDLRFFRNEEQGKMISYGIVVSNEKTENIQLENIPYFEVRNQNSFPYKLNLSTGQIDEQDKGFATYRVENIPEGVQLYLAMFTCTKAGCTPSSYYGPYNTHKSSEGTNAESMDTPVIVGIVCGTVSFAILIIARKTHTTQRSDDTSPGDTYMDLTTRTNDNPYMSYKTSVYDSIPADERF